MVRGSAWRKNNRREIRHTLGRYLAILAITALGVGFFAGLKVTRRAMVRMADSYIQEYQLFDYRLLSTIGFSQEDVDAFAALDGVKAAEGVRSADFLSPTEGEDLVLRAISLPEQVNKLQLTAGRMPQAKNECVADAVFFHEEDLGRVLTVSQEDATLGESELTIVGLCNAVTYLYPGRGASALGSGAVSAVVYVQPEAFDLEAFTEIDVTLTQGGEIFSDELQEALEQMQQPLQTLLDERAAARFDELLAQPRQELADGQAAYDEQLANYETQRQAALNIMTPEQVDAAFAEAKAQLDEAAQKLNEAREKLEQTPRPTTYCLDRSTNTGYAGFEGDSNVVEGISRVFPVFFFLVAALICTTTMTRMVEEQRTQIGTLKALGYSNGKIISKYTFYAGSASLLGCGLGFFGGTWMFPKYIWEAYKMLYHFSEISYVFDGRLAAISLAVSLLCSVGSTYAACRTELLQMPAQLMRPKAPKAGKRVLLERIGFIWNRLKFLQKVSFRNIFRYKKRLLMMLLGIAGCTALLLTGFGVSDSVADIVNDQFDTITKYDLVVTFPEGQSSQQQADFRQKVSDFASDCVFVSTQTYEVPVDGTQTLHVICAEDAAITRLIGLQNDDGPISYPTGNEGVVTNALADEAGLHAGETLCVRVSDTKQVDVPISAVTDNYVYHYLYLSADGFEALFGTPCEFSTAYLTCSGDAYAAAAKVQAVGENLNVSVVQELRDRVDNMMASLDAIVYLVVGCACALALVVLYNLSNINITERVREIATIKVLGFYPRETHQYVFRENLVLSLVGMLLGVPLGIWLHRFVMEQVHISMVSFRIHIAPISYAYALAIVLGLTLLVNAILNRKIDRIDMAESLKSVE